MFFEALAMKVDGHSVDQVWSAEAELCDIGVSKLVTRTCG